MRKLLAAFVLIAALAFAAAVVGARVAGAAVGHNGIKGVVLNTTCPGPCSEPPAPAPPYTGDGLTVKVRRLPSRELVATRHPKDGRFRVRLASGRYRVHAFVGDPRKPSCWQGEAKRVRVFEGEFTRVRLHVQNVCVV